MKKNIAIRLTTIMAMVAMAATTAFAFNGAGKQDRGMRHGYANECAQEWTKLTDDQRNKLDALRQKYIDETAAARASIVAKHEEIRILMETSSPDQEKLHSLAAELTALKKEVMDKNIDMALNAKKIAPEINVSMMIDGHGMMGGRGMRMMGGMGRGMMNCPGMNQPNPNTPPQADSGEKNSDATK